MRAAHALAAEPELHERALRDAFGRFATGVALVTTEVGGTPLGLIVSSFAAVSLDPPLVSFCPARDSLTWRRMRGARGFAVHVLASRHGEFARRAAVPGADRFAEPEVLRDALAVIECDRVAEHPAGDHSIVVGRVRGLRSAQTSRSSISRVASAPSSRTNRATRARPPRADPPGAGPRPWPP